MLAGAFVVGDRVSTGGARDGVKTGAAYRAIEGAVRGR
jgi:hypothetical protein